MLGLYWGLFFFRGLSHMVLAMVFAKVEMGFASFNAKEVKDYAIAMACIF